MTRVSNCGEDERGKYNSGLSGDQRGNEWRIKNFDSSVKWNCVLRYEGEKHNQVNSLITSMAIAAAKNNNIGYDQWQRLTFWEQLKKNDYKVNNISTPCEADCSSGVCSIIRAVGYRLKIKKLKNLGGNNFKNLYTGNMKDILKGAGFKVYYNNAVSKNNKILQPGDILFAHNTKNQHTAIVVNDNTPLTPIIKARNKQKYLRVNISSGLLNCRNQPNINSSIKGRFNNNIYLINLGKTKKNNKTWYKVKGVCTKGTTITGYCSGDYLK